MPYFPPPGAAGGGYTTIQEEGASQTQRTTVDFVGASVTVTDTGSKTQVAISGGGSGIPMGTAVATSQGFNIP